MNLITPTKFAIQRMLRSFGMEIRRFSLDEMAHLNQMLGYHRVDTVLDVGANIGQFATTLRQAGFAGRIISFEPQSDAYARLTAAATRDPNWDVAPRCAVGAAPGELTMNISDNSVSSSALPILDAHTASAPASRYIRSETAPVIALDTCDLVPASGRIFLKIDTQGFEQQVINGALNLIERVIGVQTELSLAPLYEGQADFLAIFNQMRALGFDTWAINPGFDNRETGQLLQADATFFRTPRA
jgi:FkbM family methyltransferase